MVYNRLASADAERKLKTRKPLGVIGLPRGDLATAYWKAAKTIKMPWVLVRGIEPSASHV